MLLPLLKVGFGLAAGTGASKIVQLAISNVVTSEESAKLIIKLGTFALSGAAAGIAYKHTTDTVETVEKMWKKGVEAINKVKEEVKNKKEQKETETEEIQTDVAIVTE